jgi:CrcB protein
VTQVLLIAAGGAVGAVLRYGVGGWTQQLFATRTSAVFPWGTLAVNVLGCLCMGVLAPVLFEKSLLRPEYRTAVLVGLLGAFTTWSSFGYETVRLVNDGELRLAAGYVLGTNAGCLAAVWLAYRVTERWLTAAAGGGG